MILVQLADEISKLKLGNGTSVLIYANILSSVPTSVGATLATSSATDPKNVSVFAIALFLTTLGIVYVQEAERKIPINYASRSNAASTLARQSYLPFKVNATGVMPIIFASSLLALPATVARLGNTEALQSASLERTHSLVHIISFFCLFVHMTSYKHFYRIRVHTCTHVRLIYLSASTQHVLCMLIPLESHA